jgi:hypothetical protein
MLVSGTLLMEGPQVFSRQNIKPKTILSLINPILPEQLVRNLCAEAIRRLRVTEAAAAQKLRSLRGVNAEQQDRIRFAEFNSMKCEWQCLDNILLVCFQINTMAITAK